MAKLFTSLFIILFFNNSCKQQPRFESPAGYNFTQPEILKMPGGLNEISGITFKAGNPDTMFAQQDEEGRLFFLSSSGTVLKNIKFGKKGDYEDIAICKGTVVMLRSDGVLFSFPLSDTLAESTAQANQGVLPGGEYEGIYADEMSGLLYVLCKNCRADKGGKTITGYILQMNTGNGFELKGSFQLNTKDIAEKMQEGKILFRPSALTKNPRDNYWYILSSVNKLLVITDDKWKVKETYILDPAVFPQPEGIAFDRNANLYISNERGSFESAAVLKFSFLKK